MKLRLDIFTILLALLIVLALSGCAIGHIHTSSGIDCAGIVFGDSDIACCEPGGTRTASADGSFVQTGCSTIKGGKLSTMGEAAIGAGFSAALFAALHGVF